MAAIDGVVLLAPSRLAVAVAYAGVFLWLASAWVMLAGIGAMFIGHLAGIPVLNHAAPTVMLVGGLSFVILSVVGVLLFSKFVEPASGTNGSEKTAATKGIMDCPAMAIHIISNLAFLFLEIVGFLLKCVAAKGSLLGRVASVIVYVPPYGILAMSFFVVLPGFAVEIWRMMPSGSASGSAEPVFSYDMEQQVAN